MGRGRGELQAGNTPQAVSLALRCGEGMAGVEGAHSKAINANYFTCKHILH